MKNPEFFVVMVLYMCIAIIIASLLSKEPSEEIIEEFEMAKAK